MSRPTIDNEQKKKKHRISFPVAQKVKDLPAMQETRFSPWGGKIP